MTNQLFTSPPGGASAPASGLVSVLLASPRPRLDVWMNLFQNDGRFSVVSVASEQRDLRQKMANNPEVLLLDATILDGESNLIDFLTGLPCAAYVVTPPAGGPDLPQRVLQIASVRAAYYADLNLAESAGRIYSDALALRAQKSASVGSVWGAQQGGPVGRPFGLRIISVWNQMGGVGKTTVASNLAYESARRGFPTLLIGLGAPDDLPLICGLRPEPNISKWWHNPTTEGIKLAVQKLDTLDVIPGFQDVLSEAQAMATPRNEPNSIPNLINAAAHYAGYAVIIVDAPPSALAATAISVSNTLVLVARPSLEGILRTVEAYRTVVERLKGEHRIENNRVFMVLNRVGNRLSAEEWHRAATTTLGKAFPPIVAQIPDLPAVGHAQDNRRLPLVAVEEFSHALRPLADILLAQPGQDYPKLPALAAQRKVYQLGGLRVRL